MFVSLATGTQYSLNMPPHTWRGCLPCGRGEYEAVREGGGGHEVVIRQKLATATLSPYWILLCVCLGSVEFVSLHLVAVDAVVSHTHTHTRRHTRYWDFVCPLHTHTHSHIDMVNGNSVHNFAPCCHVWALLATSAGTSPTQGREGERGCCSAAPVYVCFLCCLVKCK